MMNTAAILALIADLYQQIIDLQTQNKQLADRLAESGGDRAETR